MMSFETIAGAPLHAYRLFRDVWQHPLNRAHRVRAVARVARTYVSVRMSPAGYTAIPYVDDAVLHCTRRCGSVRICARYGLGEYADMAFCLHVLRPDDLLCDVGANAGVYTILGAKAVGCRVLAIEPIRGTFNLLMQNIHGNDVCEKVDAHQNGVGSREETLFFTSSLWSYNHVAAANDDDTEEVTVQTLDHILDGRVPTLLKMDVEGFEMQALTGAQRTLADLRLRAIVVEVVPRQLERYGDTSQQVAQTLAHAGFAGPYWYDPSARALQRPGAARERKCNHIYVRDAEAAMARAKTAPPHWVNGVSV